MTKRLLWLLLLGCAATANARVAHAQDLQLHYDWRHSVDPRNNARDFPALTFKTFKALEFGSFLLKLEANLDGTQHNVSKGYLEVSQTLRFWKAPVYVARRVYGRARPVRRGQRRLLHRERLSSSGRRIRSSGTAGGPTSRSATSTRTFRGRATTRKRRSTGGDRSASAGRSRRRACSGRRTGITATTSPPA